MLLAINTSTPQFSIALLRKTGSLLAEEIVSAPSRNFQALAPAFHNLLKASGANPKDLSAVAVAVGPGSFTGLRVGIALAKGLCQGLGIPIIGVSSLEALASQCVDASIPIRPLIDSRRGEVFTALFHRSREGNLVRMSEDVCLMMDALPGFAQENSLFVGNDHDSHAPFVYRHLGSKARLAPPHLWNLRASWVGWVGLRNAGERGFDRMPDLFPVYLRAPNIRTNPLPQSDLHP
jgi:tRNA threonylcarbamoyladenosine biosynthesis protein TsaB